jgi:thiol-disulfide isomerase/thioredoxin
MSNFSYAGQRTAEEVLYRVNANGEMVSVVEFEGSFVWADYAAPWCKPCVAQAQVIKRLENALGDDVVFVTVMTSASPEFEAIPTQETARAWSQRFGFNPHRVLAATNLWAMTIPTHILYSPEGQTLYRFTGYMPGDQIRTALFKYMKDWKNWSENAVIADWMRFEE